MTTMNKKFRCKDVSTPVDGKTVYAANWWVCVDGDPRKAVFYLEQNPQCNKNYDIVHNAVRKTNSLKSMAFCLDVKPSQIKIIYIPVAYV